MKEIAETPRRTHVRWERHGDLYVMVCAGWKRAVVYYEGGYWGVGIFDRPGPTELFFAKTLREMKRRLRERYLIWSGRGEL